MIYINNFNDSKIIPIYIGQTTNFQKRYKQHLSLEEFYISSFILCQKVALVAFVI